MPRLRIHALAIALPLALPAGGLAQEMPQSGQPCIACHGRDGAGTSPLFPNLGGQSAVYMVQQLQAFRSGQRPSEIMNIIAGSLSDEDIQALADYYARQAPCSC